MKQDLRTLTKEGREQLRLVAIRLHKEGYTQEKISSVVECRPKSVYNWIRDHKRYGKSGLKESTRGRKYGEKRSLTKDQEKDIQKLITDKYPNQLKLPFALWTGPAVQQLIRDRYGYAMPIRTLRDFLKRWGFTPQKPIKRAYEQQPAQVKKWLTEQYPAIEAKAKQENAEIHWCDETGLSSEDNRGRGYSPKGKTPVAYKTGKRFTTSIISAINNENEKEMTSSPREYMRCLQKRPGKIQKFFHHVKVRFALPA